MTRIPSAPISCFLKLHRGEMDEADAKFIDVDLVLVRARQTQNKRVVVRESYSSVTGDPSSRKEDEVAVTVIDLPDSAWTKVTTSARCRQGNTASSFCRRKSNTTRDLCSTSVWILRPQALQLRRYSLFSGKIRVGVGRSRQKGKRHTYFQLVGPFGAERRMWVPPH